MRQGDNETAMKILLVEDDPGEVQRIEAMLIGAPGPAFRVQAAADLAGGLAALGKDKFDAVLLDLFLPDSSGLTTLTRAQAAAPQVPLIVLYGGPGDRQLLAESARQGAVGFVFKARTDAARLFHTLLFAVERQRREQAACRKERKYHLLIENMKDAYYEIDLAGNFTYANKMSLIHLGRTSQQLIGLNNREFTPPDVAKQMYKAFSEVYRTGNSGKVITTTLVRPDGSTIEVELCISLIRDEQGHPIGFSGISRDVTAKVAAQKALEKSEEKYRNILNNIQDAYFETEFNGQMLFFNPAAASITGYSPAELRSMDHRGYMDEENAAKVHRAYRRIYETGKPNRSLQYEITTKSGQRRCLESSISLMHDEQGRAVAFRGVARDITQRKAVQLELARAKEKAEEATRAKSEFLANMSHEIRTPMNGIMGMYNLLQGTPLTAEQADFVETGQRSAGALLAVINDILDFSKMEAGKLEIESIDFDLRKTIDDLVATPARQAHEKGLELVYKIDHEVPSLLMGDPGRLRQAVVNLMSNAVKFTIEGEVALFVSLQEETRSKVAIRFTFKDTGIGIAKVDQARLFKSFQQVDSSTTRRFGGTGLGLAITKRLVELMGGRMGVESKPGQGSTFWFTAVFEKTAQVEPVSPIAPETVRQKRILIVDDNKTNLDILEGYLKLWGCGCDRAANGAMALSLMQAVVKAGAPYHLVISDMVMPGMDGAELGRKIKADAALRPTILVMLTSQGLRGDAAEMKRIGYSAYLTKPVRPSELFDCLTAVLNRAPGKRRDKNNVPIVTSYSLSENKRRNVRILLAEDNAINQKLALHLLGRFGFRADAVPNGKEALQALSGSDYDLVLMDIQMPEMDGLEAARMIRDTGSSVRNHDVPIVAMTAQGTQEDRDKCLHAGMNDYISKPIQPQEMLRVIEKVIAGDLPAKSGRTRP